MLRMLLQPRFHERTGRDHAESILARVTEGRFDERRSYTLPAIRLRHDRVLQVDRLVVRPFVRYVGDP